MCEVRIITQEEEKFTYRVELFGYANKTIPVYYSNKMDEIQSKAEEFSLLTQWDIFHYEEYEVTENRLRKIEKPSLVKDEK